MKYLGIILKYCNNMLLSLLSEAGVAYIQKVYTKIVPNLTEIMNIYIVNNFNTLNIYLIYLENI